MTNGEPAQDGGEEGTTTLQTAFFIMPGNALRSLRDELSISTGERMTEGILMRYGIRCGEGMIHRMNIQCYDMISLSEMLPEYYAARGWTPDGRPDTAKLDELGLG